MISIGHTQSMQPCTYCSGIGWRTGVAPSLCRPICHAGKETPEQRRAKLAARARELAAKREATRQQTATALYEQVGPHALCDLCTVCLVCHAVCKLCTVCLVHHVPYAPCALCTMYCVGGNMQQNQRLLKY